MIDRQAQPPAEDRTFTCVRRDQQLTEAGCWDGFVGAHVIVATAHPCWACPRGAARRVQYARRDFSRIPSEHVLLEMLDYCYPADRENRSTERSEKTRTAAMTAALRAETWWKETL